MFELHSENIILANLKPAGIDKDKRVPFRKSTKLQMGLEENNQLILEAIFKLEVG